MKKYRNNASTTLPLFQHVKSGMHFTLIIPPPNGEYLMVVPNELEERLYHKVAELIECDDDEDAYDTIIADHENGQIIRELQQRKLRAHTINVSKPFS